MQRNHAAGEAAIRIDADRVLGTISPFIYGQNLEPATCRKLVWPGSKLSDPGGIREDVLDIIRTRTPVPLVRWPGGNFASLNHWRDGVGPRADRPLRFDLAWRSKEDNFFGTDEFLQFCERVGAEPFMTVNAGTGTIDEAASWVEYCNMGDEPVVDARKSGIVPWTLSCPSGMGKTAFAALRASNGREKPYRVRYWSVGNETWGDFQTGNLTRRENARKAAEYAKTMKQVDPRINVTGVGMYLSNVWRFFESQPYNSSFDWNLELLRTAGEMIDQISVHRYFFREVGEAFSGTPFSPENYLALMACPIYSERKAGALASLIDAVSDTLTRKDKIKISFDEWDFGSRTLAHGLATARFFNVLHRMARTVPVACGEQWVATVLEDGMLSEASHLVFEMFQKYTGRRAVAAEVCCETYDTLIEEYRGQSFISPPAPITGVPYVDCSATMRDDGKKLFLSIVNVREDSATPCLIELRNARVARGAKVHELNAESIMSHNDREHPNVLRIVTKSLVGADGDFSYELPAHSATIIELDLS